MVQVQENHAVVALRLGKEVTSPAGPDFLAFETEILDAVPLDEWPNLFASRRGEQVTVSVKRDSFAASQVDVGAAIVCAARLVSLDHAIIEWQISDGMQPAVMHVENLPYEADEGDDVSAKGDDVSPNADFESALEHERS
jgi:hypothetical protein